MTLLLVLAALCLVPVAYEAGRRRRKPVAPVRRDWAGEVRHAHAVHTASIDPDLTPPRGIPRPR